MVKVPPWTSSGFSFFDRARVATSLMARDRPTMFISSAPRTTGTMSPSSYATATPRLTWLRYVAVPASRSRRAFTSG
jgi:hypothetical protein